MTFEKKNPEKNTFLEWAMNHIIKVSVVNFRMQSNRKNPCYIFSIYYSFHKNYAKIFWKKYSIIYAEIPKDFRASGKYLLWWTLNIYVKTNSYTFLPVNFLSACWLNFTKVFVITIIQLILINIDPLLIRKIEFSYILKYNGKRCTTIF